MNKSYTCHKNQRPKQFHDSVDNSATGLATSMSVGNKSLLSRRKEEEEVVEGEESGGGGGGAVVHKETKGVIGGGRKEEAARYNRCFSGLELSVGPGPLKDVDAGKLKGQIRRWARAVVAYARQLSFGSPRSSRSSSSRRMSRGRSGGATARSATFPSKSGLGGAKDEPEPPP